MIIRLLILVSFLLFAFLNLLGQERIQIINSIENNDSLVRDTSIIDFRDSLHLSTLIDSLQFYFYSNGYLEGSIDDVSYNDSLVQVYVNRGSKYFWKYFDLSDSIQFNENSLSSIDIFDLNNSYKRYLSLMDKNGYPLAVLKMDSFIVSGDRINLIANIDTIARIYFDTIEIKGTTNISYDFISDFLDINKDDIYDPIKLNQIVSKLGQLDYLKLADPPVVVFFGTRCKIILTLIQEKNNVFDFLIGVIPKKNTNRIDKSQWLITGDVTMSLYNKVGYGEHLFFHYKKYKASTQQMEFKVNLPYINRLPFGFLSSLEILKDDDKYLTIDGKVGLQYRYLSKNIFLDWKYNESSLIKVDSSLIVSMLKLPDDLDYIYNGVYLGIEDVKLDHKTNPRKGFRYNIYFGLGQKEIKINNKIINFKTDSIDFVYSYDSIALRKLQFEIFGTFEKYFPIWKKSTIYLGMKFSGKFDTGNLLENEKYKLGGSKRLRGFDEESIIAGIYSVFSLEYRLLLSQNSYLSLPFFDLGFIRSDIHSSQSDLFLGIGSGMSFETKVGIFNFSVAVGQSSDVPFDFGRPKVHFGYLNVF